MAAAWRGQIRSFSNTMNSSLGSFSIGGKNFNPPFPQLQAQFGVWTEKESRSKWGLIVPKLLDAFEKYISNVPIYVYVNTWKKICT